MNITKPIGMDKVCSKVEEICANPQPYKIVGIKPPHFAVGLDSGNGRTMLLEYISDMYKDSKAIDFTGGIDDYVEIALDGSLAQLNSSIELVKHSADYTNGAFAGVVGIDATKLAGHQNETQSKEFESFIEDLSESAVIILFTPTNMTASEVKYTEKIKSKLDDIICFGDFIYTDKDYVGIMLRSFENSGVEFKFTDSVIDSLVNTVNDFGIDSVPKAIKLARNLIINADYSDDVPSISDKQISDYCKSALTNKRRM